ISGQRRIEVAVTGPAQQAELLIDGQSKATASAAPFVFQWDTTKETPGLKKVVVRVRDVTGVATEKEFGVQVAGAAVATATPAAAPTAPPVTVAAPTPVPTAAPTPTPPITS